jgi:hypothetical protein
MHDMPKAQAWPCAVYIRNDKMTKRNVALTCDPAEVCCLCVLPQQQVAGDQHTSRGRLDTVLQQARLT